MTAFRSVESRIGCRLGPIELWTDLARNLRVASVFARRTTRARFRQSVFGYWWMVVQPLAMIAIFIGVFGRSESTSTSSDGSYPSLVVSTVVAWQLFATISGGGGTALISDSDVIRKVRVCRLAIVVGKTGPALVQFVVGLIVVLIVAPFIGGKVGPLLIWLPLLAVLLLLPALAISIAASSLAVWLRDVNFGLPFLVQMLLFVSPVFYPATRYGDDLILYATLNPLVGPLDGFRRVYSLGEAPDMHLISASGLGGLLLLFAATEIFRRLEPRFADVI